MIGLPSVPGDYPLTEPPSDRRLLSLALGCPLSLDTPGCPSLAFYPPHLAACSRLRTAAIDDSGPLGRRSSSSSPKMEINVDAMTPEQRDKFFNGPAHTPPNGTRPNFDHPKDLVVEFIIMCTICSVLTGVFVVIRFYTRWKLTRRFLLEDCE